ncbi:hypothetical protein [Maribacter sp. 6B07]|uniref:hypothetical protein n=1 Tax=Maribacter sp. 6B07 TaxID=2045442 RepID=UPI00117D83EE|nr:hypothetical protein [Maribacter sp. 6B07]
MFTEPFGNLISSQAREVIAEIDSQPDEYFDSIPTEEFSKYLESKYSLDEFPTLVWEEIEMEIGETEIYGRDLPRTFDISNPNEKFKRKLVVYHIPINGNVGLLRFSPTNRYSISGMNGKLTIRNNTLDVSFIDIYNQPEKIDSDFDRTKNAIAGKLNVVKGEYDNFHKELPKFIDGEIKKRIQKINRTNDYKSKFKYPIKKKNIPAAFESPRIVKKKKIIPKPVGASNTVTNQRFITDEDYMHILGLLQDCGNNWEHFPELYKGKGEEALRDQLIFVLAPNIEGVVAGEAYNKKGKTDISIKHESTNLFIGECKIWKGPKGFLETIDQILCYLTWRDSKAAIMMFVPNQEISAVRKATEESAKSHPNFVRILDVINDGWTNYRFHIENDPGTYITLAVQLYHLPKL